MSAAYFGVHTLSRILISGTLELDESEQVLLAQQTSLGYGSQPPLYTWIQAVAFEILGWNTVAIASVKNALLFSTCLFVYLSARQATRNHRCGLLAAASLLFIPQIAWEAQRDLTHSVLATALAAATLWLFLRLAERPTLSAYAGFGCLAGLGLLAKYNYAVFLFGLSGAAVSLRAFRPVVLDRGFLLSLGIAAGLVMPHAWWITDNFWTVIARSADVEISKADNPFRGIAFGLTDLTFALFLYTGLLGLVYLGCFGRSFPVRSREANRSSVEILLIRTLLLVVGVLALMVVVFRITEIKARWFQPLLIGLPVLLAVWVRDRAESARARRFFVLAGSTAVGLLVLFPSYIIAGPSFGKLSRLTAPLPQLAAELEHPLQHGDWIVADTRWIGGNLQLRLPHIPVRVPEISDKLPERPGDVWVVWNATKHPTLPKRLVDHLAFLGLDRFQMGEACYLEAPYRYSRKHSMRMGVVRIDR